MNENINLVDILKDCPKGYKLYSTIHGEVKFERIINDKNYPILFKYSDIACEFHVGNVTKDGRHKVNYDGECTLFPEKSQRDWSKFKVEPEMIDGEFYYCSLFNCVNDSIYIHRKSKGHKTEYYVKLDLFDLALLENCIITTHEGYIKELRKATEEEKQQLLNVIKRDGYKWDEEKKILVKDEPKFDISTLQPFDRVLVRNGNNNKWTCAIYAFKENDKIFRCENYGWTQCIPYNDETKHLVGTTKMPPKKYTDNE